MTAIRSQWGDRRPAWTERSGRERRDSTRLRMAILGVVVLSLFATMLARLWYLQVLAAPELKVEAQTNSVRLVYTEAPRGKILDRNGEVLVDNRIVPTAVVDRDAARAHPDLVPRLAALLGRPQIELERRLQDERFSLFKPVPVVEDVPKEKVVYLRENQAAFPGVGVVQIAQRSYPHGTLGAHLLGYVGEINDVELEARRALGYRGGDTIGKSGAELAYEAALRGVPQVEKLQVDSQGRVLRSLGVQPPVPGHDVQLTIDIKAQALAEESLKQGLETAQQTWDPEQLKRYLAPAGAVVVQDPRDGSILAMASYPTYHPDEFVNGISTARFRELNDPANHYPLNNRVLQGLYAPASTFKLVTSLAGLSRDAVAPNTTITDAGSIQIGDRVFRNAFGTPHGRVNLARALAVSSDVYYYLLGEKLDESRKPFPIPEAARSFGLGRATGIELPFELEGWVPDPDNKKKRNEENPQAFPFGEWFTGDNVNLSIGQGDLVVTPLQLTNVYATFANGGTEWVPHVGHAIRDVVTGAVETIAPRQQSKVNIPPAHREAVLEGLQRVVTSDEGTGYGAFFGFPLAQFPIAGKTGTAEVSGDKQETALFVGFGPADSPRYVVSAVMEESGLGSSAAAPVVRRIFDGLIGNPPRPVARVANRID